MQKPQMQNKGAIFVRNYFTNVWRKENQQTQWTAYPKEDDLSKVIVLYDCRPEIGVFSGLQLVFQVQFHEDHPFKAPSIRTLTPNGRMKVGESICIDGLTAWHPESWNPITSFSSVVERFMCAFIDIENVSYGAGFITPPNPTEIAKCVEKSREWNKENQMEVYQQFTNQCLKTESTNSSVKKTETDEEEEETEYVYSDEED